MAIFASASCTQALMPIAQRAQMSITGPAR
jgi:hypothetical protein